jgi:hypothetical protein
VGSREAIARLIYACDDHNDRGDFAGVGALFAHGTRARERHGRRWIDCFITVELHGDLSHHLHARTTPFA